jgi:hypothetical protein
MKLTPSQTTNLMRRGLRLLFDPEPSPDERKLALDFFMGRCAYCDEQTNGHHDLDHLVSSATGGANHISNRVPSCKPCNAEHKREQDWRRVLGEKWVHDPKKLAELTARIEEWVRSCAVYAPPQSIVSVWNQECVHLTIEFSGAVSRIRQAMASRERDKALVGKPE